MKKKAHILVPLSFNFQIRYIIRTGLLEQINKFCNTTVLLFWNQGDLIEELTNLGYNCVSFSLEEPDSEYKYLKSNIDLYYWKNILKSPTFKIKERRRWKKMGFKSKLRQLFYLFIRGGLSYHENEHMTNIERLKDYARRSNNFRLLNNLINQLDISAIFTTAPFLYSEEMTCQVGIYHNIPIFYSVLSFDNLTTRGYLPFTAQHCFVWNKFNKNEFLRIQPSISHDKVSITGPAQFDFYYTDQYIKNEQEWRKGKTIPEGRPIILYGANAKIFVPNEFLIVKSIDEAIAKGNIKNNPLILLRPHPTDSFTDWENFVKTCENVYIEKSLEKNQTEDKMYNKFSNFTVDDVINLCSSLAHSAVHISYASTLALDGACFDKPQICPYFAPDNSVSDKEIRNLYHSEHYSPIRLSGAVALPRNHKELIECINIALTSPELKSKERAELLDQMITYRDGKATERIASELERLISELV